MVDAMYGVMYTTRKVSLRNWPRRRSSACPPAQRCHVPRNEKRAQTRLREDVADGLVSRSVCHTEVTECVIQTSQQQQNPRACATMSPTSPRRIAARFPPPPPPPLLLSRRPPTALPPPPRDVPVLPLDQRCGRDEASHQNRRLSDRRECNCRCCRLTSAAARRGRARVQHTERQS